MNKHPLKFYDAWGKELPFNSVPTPTSNVYVDTILYTECPKCGALPKFCCETPSGKEANNHKVRTEAFVFLTGK